MATRFTLGIEEEFQLVDRQTGELRSCADAIIARGANSLGEQLKQEMSQSTIELVSNVFPDIATARKETCATRAALAQLVKEEGLAIISAGTHPSSSWRDQKNTEGERYIELAEEYQDVVRSDLIFGLHVHVGVQNKDLAITIMNQVRTWLPHLLALSTNAPFWSGRMTGLKSYRAVQWKRFPRSGVPYIFPSWEHFDQYVQDLVEMGCIDDGKKIWWDVRPHAYFDTIEFRVCDMPSTLEDTLAIAALCQALVATLAHLHEQGKTVPVVKSRYIEENKWRAMRYGLDAEVVDFTQRRRLSMRDSLREVLEFVDDVVDDLGSRQEITYLHTLLADKQGTGADRQIAIYRETQSTQKVIAFLLEQTMQGV
ncbi:MAG: carboxylate-amine ligase [Ktedonobacteraceae bacterium]